MLTLASTTLAAQNAERLRSATPAGHLAPGDDVVVLVFQERDLSGRSYVDDHGQIVLPRIGPIDASTLTAAMLRDTVRTRYAGFLRDPSVDVRALRRVTVNGAVLKPDVYFIDPSMTLRDAIARAGGVTPEGDYNTVTLVRDAHAQRYADWMTTDTGATELRSGDEIVISRRSWLTLNVGTLVAIGGVLTSLAIAFIHH